MTGPKRRRLSRVPEDLPATKPPKTTATTVEARRAAVEAEAARGDWLAAYVVRCAKALDVTFPDENAFPPRPKPPNRPKFLRRSG